MTQFKFQVKLAGSWVNYPDKADKQILHAYQQGKKEVTFQLKVGNKKNDYTLNFVTMKQSSPGTDKTRPVRPPYDIEKRADGGSSEKEGFAGDDVSDVEKKKPPPKVVIDNSGKEAVQKAIDKECTAITSHKRFEELVAKAEKEKCDPKVIAKVKEALKWVTALEKALEGIDIKALDDAAKKAKDFKLSGPLLQQVDERKKEMGMAVARKMIREVMEKTAATKGKNEEELLEWKAEVQKVMKEAKAKGLGEEELKPTIDRTRKIHNAAQDLKGAIRVYCRTRPFNTREKDMGAKEVINFHSDGMNVTLRSPEGDEEKFGFDMAFHGDSKQESVYNELESVVENCLLGYNCTVFAYGQTGSGKTWTMYGPKENPGVVCRAIKDLFVMSKPYEETFECIKEYGMCELYLQTFSDLMAEKSAKPVELTIRKNKEGETFLDGQLFKVAKDANDLWKSIEQSFDNRKVAATAMNANSSRSHLIVTIKSIMKNKTTGQVINGKLVMVDLAGSERVKDSMVEGDQLKEAIEINKSLTALGNVMEQLTTNAKGVAYRDHAITNILQDSLGGTAKTLMFANVSPASVNFAETVMTCKWAQRAKKVTNDGGKAKQAAAKEKSKAKAKPAAKKR